MERYLYEFSDMKILKTRIEEITLYFCFKYFHTYTVDEIILYNSAIYRINLLIFLCLPCTYCVNSSIYNFIIIK